MFRTNTICHSGKPVGFPSITNMDPLLSKNFVFRKQKEAAVFVTTWITFAGSDLAVWHADADRARHQYNSWTSFPFKRTNYTLHTVADSSVSSLLSAVNESDDVGSQWVWWCRQSTNDAILLSLCRSDLGVRNMFTFRITCAIFLALKFIWH